MFPLNTSLILLYLIIFIFIFQEGVNDLTIQNVTQEDAGEYICQINTEPMKNYVSLIQSCTYVMYIGISHHGLC